MLDLAITAHSALSKELVEVRDSVCYPVLIDPIRDLSILRRPFGHLSAVSVAKRLYIEAQTHRSRVVRQHTSDRLGRSSAHGDIEVRVRNGALNRVEVIRSFSSRLRNDRTLPLRHEIKHVFARCEVAVLIKPESAADESLNAEHVLSLSSGEERENEGVELEHQVTEV